MAKHRRSLLDAFRAVPAAKGEPVRTIEAEAVRVVPQRTAARADAAIPVRVAAQAPPQPPRRAGTHADVAPPRPPMARQRIVFLSLLALTIVVVVLLALKSGRGASGVEAANDPALTSGGARTPAVQTPAQFDAAAAKTQVPAAANAPRKLDASAGYTDDDRAFFDPKNRFTVRLAEYSKDASGERLAREAYKYLLSEGAPVVQPIQSADGTKLFLCAGAKASKDELSVLHEWVRRLRGPGGRKPPFDTAYVDNISHVR